jgi:2-polyprenyl-3-methyl-5-hydroxy-6-metoxy-1,4-benzoquinol methylase
MKPIISNDGWAYYSIWEHSANVRDLYAARARGEAPEMDCAAQAAELLAPHAQPGDSVLDAGCGSGYFFHSLKRRGMPVEYYGIDASPTLIDIGRKALIPHGLEPDRLRVLRIEDLDGEADHVICMNVLSNIDNYHRPLERLLNVAQKTLILRESAKAGAQYAYVQDMFVDKPLNVHVNAYDADELVAFMQDFGFDVERVTDRRTGGDPELVIGHPHWWTFFRAVRNY